MTIKDINISNEWLNFIDKFIAGQSELIKKKTDSDWTLFQIENYLNTDIDFSNKYGFLTLSFKEIKKAQSYISISGISHLMEKVNDITTISTSWNSENYPCRVFISNNKRQIYFYDSEKIIDNKKLYNNRIITFENIILTILKLKIISASE